MTDISGGPAQKYGRAWRRDTPTDSWRSASGRRHDAELRPSSATGFDLAPEHGGKQKHTPWAHPRTTDLEAEIRASESLLLEMPSNWADESPEPLDQGAWKRAIEYLRREARFAERLSTRMATPRIRIGPRGSVDLRWRTSSFEALINFPADISANAGFYADDGAANRCVKGSIDQRALKAGLIAWLCIDGD